MDIEKKHFSKKRVYAIGYPSDEQLTSLSLADSCGKLWATKHYITDRRSYDKLLFVYVNEGSMFLDYGGVRRVVHEGSAFFIDCMPHQIYGTHEKSCVLTFLHIVGGASHYFYQEITSKRGHVFSGVYAQIVKKAVEDVSDCLTEHSQNKTELLSYIITKAFYDLLITEPKVESQFKDTINMIKEAVLVGRQINVDDLATFVGYSKYYFTRKFTSQLGISPYEYILSERLELAKNRLINTTKSVGDIALDSGFYDTSHMSNCFKKREGISPLEFRDKWKSTI